MIDGLLTVLINHDCKTSCGLIQDGLLTNQFHCLDVLIYDWRQAFNYMEKNIEQVT